LRFGGRWDERGEPRFDGTGGSLGASFPPIG
jgi:hypothetical protein